MSIELRVTPFVDGTETRGRGRAPCQVDPMADHVVAVIDDGVLTGS